MGLFSSSSLSLEKIDQVVTEHFDKFISSPDQFFSNDFIRNFDAMLDSLSKWVKANKLGMWKTARVLGNIEGTLRRYMPSDVASELVKRARSKIT